MLPGEKVYFRIDDTDQPGLQRVQLLSPGPDLPTGRTWRVRAGKIVRESTADMRSRHKPGSVFLVSALHLQKSRQ